VKPTLLVGLSGRKTFEVTPGRTTDHAARPVLATPAMIALMEWTCLEVTADHVDSDEATVGIHVCVSHESAVMEGESIDIAVELIDISGRKMTFTSEITGPRGRVSEGTHQRAVIKLPTTAR
jgi:fluoroacetyl-CoA thioesterase